jgi:ABC-2 type transport system ATP-binding protein
MVGTSEPRLPDEAPSGGHPVWGLESVSAGYGPWVVLHDVTVPAAPHCITVVVGGDGAGKTTSLRCLVGLVPSRRGTARRPGKPKVGYVPAIGGIYRDLSTEENLAFSAEAYAVGRAELSKAVDAALENVGLTAARHRLGGHLAGGMQRKLALGMALLHRPELVVLDEPTTGVDPLSRVELWRLISQAAASGAAVVMATTYVSEAARANTAVLLESGRVLASGPPGAIVANLPGAIGTCRSAPKWSGEGSHFAWRRGRSWRVWAEERGDLPVGTELGEADLEDAAVVAGLLWGASGR